MKPTLYSYIAGFLISVALTLAAFAAVRSPAMLHLRPGAVVPAIIALALAQLVAQLVFFLHLADESGSRWKLAIFVSTVGIVLIVVMGSMWIMDHLNRGMMASPDVMNGYIMSQDGL